MLFSAIGVAIDIEFPLSECSFQLTQNNGPHAGEIVGFADISVEFYSSGDFAAVGAWNGNAFEFGDKNSQASGHVD